MCDHLWWVWGWQDCCSQVHHGLHLQGDTDDKHEDKDADDVHLQGDTDDKHEDKDADGGDEVKLAIQSPHVWNNPQKEGIFCVDFKIKTAARQIIGKEWIISW